MSLPVCSMILMSLVFAGLAVCSLTVNYAKIAQSFNKFEIPKLTWEVAKVAPFAAAAVFCIVGVVKKEVVIGNKTLVTVKKCGNASKTAQACSLCSISNMLAKR